MYHRNKHRVGHIPESSTQIPAALLGRGFGISTKMNEPVGAIVQQTQQNLPNDVTLHCGYQTNRSYDWRRAGINPLTHRFGIKSTGNADHLNAVFEPEHTTYIVATAVDRAGGGATVPDPDPHDPKPRILARTMLASQINPKKDPAERPPAGVTLHADEFTIGDTIASMGGMDAFDRDHLKRPKKVCMAERIVHGMPTKPNPFKNPLAGPGKFADLGLSDEEFLRLRDKDHVVPVMAKALDLGEEEAGVIFDRVAARVGRESLSVSEFYGEVRGTSG
jgi:hypothetical protein